MDKTCYRFDHANIHERRFAARFTRVVPFGLVVAAAILALVGVTVDITLLLAVCAVLNLSVWLWICSAAVYGILGASVVSENFEDLEPTAVAVKNTKDVDEAAGGELKQDGIRHVIVFPNYKEDEEMMAETLQSLKEAAESADFWVVLAMEAREGQGATDKAERLKQRFANTFAKVLAVYHPPDLKEYHLDGSCDEEVPGKASNLKYAVAKAHDACIEDTSVAVSNTVLTVSDADCIFHPNYFAQVSAEFKAMQASPGEQHRWTMWQAPQLPFINYYEAPAPSRVWGYISSVYEFGGVSSLTSGGHHMVFSSYSLSLQLAHDGKLWDGDVIAEDHHAYVKAFLYSARISAMEAVDAMRAGRPTRGCRPPLRVRPVMLPVKSTSVIDPDGYWATYVARWHQATRHCQGVAELSYCLLATWDLLWTLPLSVYNLHFLMHLGKVIFRPLFMHIMPIAQSLGLAVLTLYWLFHHRSVPMCPDRIWMASADGNTMLCGLAGAWALTWPMVIPLMLVAVANFRFLMVSFIRQGARANRKELWYRKDSNTPETCGSVVLTLTWLIAIDCVMMCPLMAVYGALAEVVAFWNVMWRGNSFTYVTASKATTLGADYGSTRSGGA